MVDDTADYRTISSETSRRAYLTTVGSAFVTTAGCISDASDEESDPTTFTVGEDGSNDGNCMECVSPSPAWAIHEQLTAESNGEVEMNLISEGQVCNSETCSPKTERGIIQAGYGSIGNSTGAWPENSIWLLPFTFPSRAALVHTVFGERMWNAYWIPFARRYGVVPFFIRTPALRNILLSGDATDIIGGRAKNRSDIEELQIRRTESRVPQVVLSEWGASPLELAWGDTIQGMDSGVVHGLETWSSVGIADGMADVVDQVIILDFMSGQGVTWANVDWLQRLSEEDRLLINEITREQSETATHRAEAVVDERVGHADPPPEGTEYGNREMTINLVNEDELAEWREPVDPIEHPELYDQERELADELTGIDGFYDEIYETARGSSAPETPEDVSLDVWWGDFIGQI